MENKLKIVYMGTPDFAVEPLKRLVSGGCMPLLAVTQPDRARDRGKKIQPTPVKQAALEAGIPVEQPEKIRNNTEFLEKIRSLAPDIIIVAAYGKILPPDLLSIPPLGCVNIHASLLPRFRGAAPVNRSIMAGDRETGVTLMYMEEGLDTGDMIAKASVDIGRKNAGQLLEELSAAGADLLLEYLPRIASGDIDPQPQDDSLSCYAPMITKEEGHMDFSKSAWELDCLVRGMPEKPGTYADYQGVSMKIRRAQALEEETGAPAGTIAGIKDGRLLVACGRGTLAVEIIQMPGKKAMSVADYLKGNSIETGTVLQ